MEFRMEIVRVGSLVVFTWLHTASDPEPEPWEQAMRQVRQATKQRAADSGVFRSFVVSDGGAPNAKQRAELFTDVLPENSLSAVVTNSLNNPFKRGIARALSWLNPAFQAFPPERSRGAFEHIGCLGWNELSAVWNALLTMQREVQFVRTLNEIAKHMDLRMSVDLAGVRQGAG